jgi:hypothetical protein
VTSAALTRTAEGSSGVDGYGTKAECRDGLRGATTSLLKYLHSLPKPALTLWADNGSADVIQKAVFAGFDDKKCLSPGNPCASGY